MSNIINTILSFIFGWFTNKAKTKAKTSKVVQDIKEKGEKARNEADSAPDPRYQRD